MKQKRTNHPHSIENAASEVVTEWWDSCIEPRSEKVKIIANCIEKIGKANLASSVMEKLLQEPSNRQHADSNHTTCNSNNNEREKNGKDGSEILEQWLEPSNGQHANSTQSSVLTASALFHTVRQWHDNPQSRALPMLVHKYVDENGSAVMPAAKRSADVTPEMNLREHTSYTPLPSADKTAHSGFKTQKRRHQKSKTGLSVASTNRTDVLQKKLKIKQKQKIDERDLNGNNGSKILEQWSAERSKDGEQTDIKQLDGSFQNGHNLKEFSAHAVFVTTTKRKFDDENTFQTKSKCRRLSALLVFVGICLVIIGKWAFNIHFI